MSRWKLCLALCCLPVLAASAQSQEKAASTVYIVFDGSGSMWGQLADGTHKVTAAREVLNEFVGQDFGDRELALRAYGHRRKGDCADSELVVGFSSPQDAAGSIRDFAQSVNPKGKTPIGRSLRAALDDMGDRPGEIILISDGIETCGDDPCALVKAWRDKDIAIKVHVVGLGLDEQEKAAMQCIADAAGTSFKDAQSAEELAAGLETIREASVESSSPPVSSWQVLDVIAENESGERMRVFGVARQEGSEEIKVGSNGHNKVPEGTWDVTVGVKTKNGNLYKPVTQTVEVGSSGATKAYFVVPEPPSVKARFMENGEQQGGSAVSAYQDGERVLGFRAKDRAYIDPGEYEFRVEVNQDNHLTLTEDFQDGDHKEIVFELVPTIKAKLTLVAEGSEIPFRSNYELWQNGEKRYSVHSRNGVRALPGTYDVRLPLYLTPYMHKGLVLTTEAQQDVRIEVPVGHLTVHYEKADGSRIPGTRCFIARVTTASYKSDGIKTSDERFPLTAGKYTIKGWYVVGDFEPVTIEMKVGEDKEITLRSKS